MSRQTRIPDTSMSGFTLIEALVALVVLSIGMLGIAALYVESLKAGRSAIYRTQAVALAADMADRIRANPVAEEGGPVATAVSAAYEGAGADGGCVSAVANCTQAGMAAHDVLLWKARTQELLPSGQGTIQHDAGPIPDQFTITVSWSEVGDPNPATYSLVVQI
ncbi:MAG: type IV pilus modification protein PilV [Gammaproteobacteria bacterium]